MQQKNSNTIQAFWLAIGNLAAFGFTIVSAAILSRYLTKSDYGTYRQILYIYTSLLVIFSVGLPKAFSYFLPRVDITEGKSLVKKMTIIFLMLGAALSLLLFFGSSLIASILRNPELEKGLKYFSPVPMLMLPTMGIEGIYATFKKTYVIAIYTILTRVAMLLFIAIPVLVYKNNYLTAVMGFVVSSFLSFLMAIYLKYKPFFKIASVSTSITYKEIFKFSLPLMYASIWGIAITSADQFFISRYFGKSVFADFANGSLQLPFVVMISGATSSVLQPVFSKMVSEGGSSDDMLPIWRVTFEKSAILIYPLVLFFWVFADAIMVLLYGNMYHDSSVFFRVMSVYNFFNVIVFAPAILALGATRFYARIHFYIAVIIWIAQFAVVRLFHNAYLVSVVSVLCRSAMILVLCGYIAKRFRVHFYDLFPIKPILRILVSCSLVLALLKTIVNYLPASFNSMLVLTVAFGIYLLVIVATGKITRIDYLKVFQPLLVRFRK